jgi:hypothetical protein
MMNDLNLYTQVGMKFEGEKKELRMTDDGLRMTDDGLRMRDYGLRLPDEVQRRRGLRLRKSDRVGNYEL